MAAILSREDELIHRSLVQSGAYPTGTLTKLLSNTYFWGLFVTDPGEGCVRGRHQGHGHVITSHSIFGVYYLSIPLISASGTTPLNWFRQLFGTEYTMTRYLRELWPYSATLKVVLIGSV